MKISDSLKESMNKVIEAGKYHCNIGIVCLFCDFNPYCKSLRDTYKLAREYLQEDKEA